MRLWIGVIGVLLVSVWTYDNLAMISGVFLWTFGTAVAVLVIVGLLGLATAIAGAVLSSPIALLALLLGLGLGSGDD